MKISVSLGPKETSFPRRPQFADFAFFFDGTIEKADMICPFSASDKELTCRGQDGALLRYYKLSGRASFPIGLSQPSTLFILLYSFHITGSGIYNATVAW
jgi:hypothetical protein